jgi:hypothetical protein
MTRSMAAAAAMLAPIRVNPSELSASRRRLPPTCALTQVWCLCGLNLQNGTAIFLTEITDEAPNEAAHEIVPRLLPAASDISLRNRDPS